MPPAILRQALPDPNRASVEGRFTLTSKTFKRPKTNAANPLAELAIPAAVGNVLLVVTSNPPV